MVTDTALTGQHILVTRPEGLAASLCDNITRHGGKATHFPVIEIVAAENRQVLQQAIGSVNDYDIAIFISPTAVRQAARHMSLSEMTCSIGAIGDATTKALQREAVTVDIQSEGHNSESLLLHPALQQNAIDTRRIMLFKGEGGLSLLENTLRDRGAEVFNACIYSRKIPSDYSPLSTRELSDIDSILVSSGEGLNNLVRMTEDKAALLNKPIIVPGKRCADIARTLGFRSIAVSDNATNDSFMDALLNP